MVGLGCRWLCGKVEVSSKTLDTACLALDKSSQRRVLSTYRKAVPQSSKGTQMELSDTEAKAVKAIYSDFHAGATDAEEALHALEQLINGDSEEDN